GIAALSIPRGMEAPDAGTDIRGSSDPWAVRALAARWRRRGWGCGRRGWCHHRRDRTQQAHASGDDDRLAKHAARDPRRFSGDPIRPYREVDEAEPSGAIGCDRTHHDPRVRLDETHDGSGE